MLRLLAAAALSLAFAATAACRDERDRKEAPVPPTPPPPAAKVPADGTRLATFGGGCFWCAEALFSRVEGVRGVESGFSGGSVPNPTYPRVCEGDTGHAEVIQVRYDPAKVSYESLLEIFWKTHDPTTLNRQGADTGTQYRSIVLWHDDAQRKTAESVKKDLEAAHVFDAPIVTQIVPFVAFWRAEDYHQGYFARNPDQGYCQMVIAPKVAKLEKVFRDRLKK